MTNEIAGICVCAFMMGVLFTVVIGDLMPFPIPGILGGFATFLLWNVYKKKFREGFRCQ